MKVLSWCTIVSGLATWDGDSRCQTQTRSGIAVGSGEEDVVKLGGVSTRLKENNHCRSATGREVWQRGRSVERTGEKDGRERTRELFRDARGELVAG